MNFQRLVCFFAGLLLSQTSLGVDKNNIYAIKGAGLSSCKSFLQSVDNQDSAYLVYGGWIEGHITALNQQLENTFDLTPWQTTPFLLKLIAQNCRNKPEVQFHQMVRAMLGEFLSQKIVEGKSFIKLNNDNSLIYQEDVIVQTKKALQVKGYFEGELDMEWNQDSVQALKKFQNDKSLPETGFPSQDTLFYLFYSTD